MKIATKSRLVLLLLALGALFLPAVNEDAEAQVSQPLKVTDTVTTAYPTYTLTFPSGTITKSGTNATYTATGSGTVTSVGLALPSIFSVSGSPVTTAGTLTGALATQTANLVFSGPTSGGAAAPTFRSLVAADIPSLSATYLPLAGGTMSGAITLSGTQLGTYSLGGTPTLAATLALGGQTLSGNATFSGAITASGSASFDLSGGSGVFKTSTGAVTIGTGAIGITGAVTNNIGGTSAVPWTTTGVASQNGYVYTGTAPASVSGTGTNAGSAFLITGAVGGATTGNATTAGNGEGLSWTAGNGGSGAGGTNANGGAGGSLLYIPGTGGAASGAGVAGAGGTLTVRAKGASHGNLFQVQSSTPTTNFAVTDAGALTLVGPIATSTTSLTIAGTGATSGINLQARGSTYMDVGVTQAAFVALAANVGLGGNAGTGGLELSSMTGNSNFPTGDFAWAGAASKVASLVAASSITLTAGGVSTWKTTSGDLILDAGAVLSLGAATATSMTLGRADQIATWQSPQAAGAATNTIADPGTGTAIPVTRSGVCMISVTANETNTLANPTFVGQRISISTGATGANTLAITVANSFNDAGNTVITLQGTNRTFVELQGITVSGALRWQILTSSGAALS